MKWEHEPWRKLYRNCPPEWLLMPVSARGLGSELLKYADDDGTIHIGKDEPATAIIYMLGARPKEHKRIREDVSELFDISYLVLEGQKVRIRNFVPAQDRTPGAKRTAEWRARQASRETSHVTSRETSPETSHVTDTSDDGVTPYRVESNRIDREGASAPKPPARSRRKPATGIPADVAPWLASLGIPPESDPEVAKFLDHHRSKANTFADWLAAWRNWQRRSAEYAGSNGHQVELPAEPRRHIPMPKPLGAS